MGHCLLTTRAAVRGQARAGQWPSDSRWKGSEHGPVAAGDPGPPWTDAQARHSAIPGGSSLHNYITNSWGSALVGGALLPALQSLVDTDGMPKVCGGSQSPAQPRPPPALTSDSHTVGFLAIRSSSSSVHLCPGSRRTVARPAGPPWALPLPLVSGWAQLSTGLLLRAHLTLPSLSPSPGGTGDLQATRSQATHLVHLSMPHAHL